MTNTIELSILMPCLNEAETLGLHWEGSTGHLTLRRMRWFL